MKKKNLKKLALRKTCISALEKSAVNGGIDLTIQETIDFTACYGDQLCQLYQTAEDCGGGTRRC
ncbi:hypothetical protein [Ascidiimonas aurantiaca]|uniref:hypothetical protein n=1 Tax=Ascidiimonas aurantiaca TaxID=1685432 RepID=UPI0030EB7997